MEPWSDSEESVPEGLPVERRVHSLLRRRRRARVEKEGNAAGTADSETMVEQEVQMVKECTYFYNQTVGLMFVWTLENAVMALLGYGLFLLVDTVLSERVLIAWWASLNLLGSTLLPPPVETSSQVPVEGDGANAVCSYWNDCYVRKCGHEMPAPVQCQMNLPGCINSVHQSCQNRLSCLHGA
eukprot:2662085-Rhodomonas_salina.2